MIEHVVLLLSLGMALAGYGLLASWYVMPRLGTLPLKDSLTALILPHAFRFVGLAFLVPGVTSIQLDRRFAEPAAYGDLLTALLALVAMLALRSAWTNAKALVWIFNSVGFIDLILALSLGLRYASAGELGATFFIPTLVVPALLVSHVLVFQLLPGRRHGFGKGKACQGCHP